MARLARRGGQRVVLDIEPSWVYTHEAEMRLMAIQTPLCITCRRAVTR